MIPVLPDYFKAMGGRLLCGRDFTDEEVRSDARVIVVSKRFAAAFGSPADILQHQVTFRDMPPREIIGVVDGMDYMSGEMPEAIQSSQMFLPAHSPGGFFSTFVVRVNGRARWAFAWPSALPLYTSRSIARARATANRCRSLCRNRGNLLSRTLSRIVGNRRHVRRLYGHRLFFFLRCDDLSRERLDRHPSHRSPGHRGNAAIRISLLGGPVDFSLSSRRFLAVME